MSDCFLCARLTDAAAAADARASSAEQVAVLARAQASDAKLKARAKLKLLNKAMVDVLRALHSPPFLVFPHVAPSPPTQMPAGGRFALLELE